MQQEIFFTLSEMKTQKMNMQERKERKFEEKVRESVNSSNIYIVVFAFLF